MSKKKEDCLETRAALTPGQEMVSHSTLKDNRRSVKRICDPASGCGAPACAGGLSQNHCEVEQKSVCSGVKNLCEEVAQKGSKCAISNTFDYEKCQRGPHGNKPPIYDLNDCQPCIAPRSDACCPPACRRPPDRPINQDMEDCKKKYKK